MISAFVSPQCKEESGQGKLFGLVLDYALHLLSALDYLIDVADHIKSLFWQVIMLSFDDLSETANSFVQGNILSFSSCKGSCHEEGLRQEALNLSGASDCQLIFFG